MPVKNLFATRWGIIGVGGIIGILAPLLQKLGNPGNMGICVACFERDIAGSIGLHRADVVQYMRPEIIGFVLGSLIAAYIFKEFRPRVGSAPIVRFVLGAFAMIGALVFLGCPWRAVLRLAGGDGNAILGVLGLTFGIWIGTLFLKNGYNLGRTQSTYPTVGWMLPLTMLGFLALLIVFPQIPNEAKSGVLFYSLKGPGSMHAPLIGVFDRGSWHRISGTTQPFLHHGRHSRCRAVRPDASFERVHQPGRFRLFNQPGFRTV